MKNIAYVIVMLSVCILSCENSDWDFSDYKTQTVYFAEQYPVRTITLGEDIFDTSLDNEWKCQIMATTGGVYKANSNVTIDIAVDNSMCDGLDFANSGGRDIIGMPTNYYTLASNRIVIPKGKLIGGVEVQLTDDFFADPQAIRNTYVIPVRMTNVLNADSILSGASGATEPRRGVSGDWAIAPKDYVFYAIKYVNPWHGYYLRRGIENVTGEVTASIVRHKKYVEDDEVQLLTTRSLSEVEYPVIVKDKNGNNITCTLILAFDENGGCTISSGSQAYTATGTGKFASKAEKKAWGDKDRDALYLNYSMNLNTMQVNSTDTLVLRNRGIAMELFNPVLE